jgi:hypothetical protein
VGKAEGRDVTDLRVPPKPEIKQQQHQDRRKFCVIPWAAVQDRQLPASSLRYLAALSAYANPAGITWVGLKKVGQDLGVSHVAVHKHMTRIKARGYVEELSKGWAGEKAYTRRIVYDPEVTAEDAVSINSAKEDCRDPDMKRKEAQEMARQKKQAAPKEPGNSLHNVASCNPEPVTQPEKMDWDEGIRVAYRYVVNVDENALRWLAMAMELGCTRGMLETCSREADPVGAVKVLVTRLDRACR